MTTLDLSPLEQDLLKRAEAPRDLPAWAEDLAKDGAARFAASGLPHRRLEDWKYTDLKTRLRAAPKVMAETPRVAMALTDAVEVTLTRDGIKTNSPLEEGVVVLSLSEALSKQGVKLARYMGATKALNADALSGLSAALMETGFVIFVSKDVRPGKPILLRSAVGHASEPSFSRNLLVLEEGASLTLVEDWSDPKGETSLRHMLTEINLGKGAELSHLRVQNETLTTSHLSLVAADLAEGADYRQYALNFGAGLTRNETHVDLGGEQAHAELGGTFLLNGQQHSDTTTVVTHAVPNCTSREVFRGVMTDRSRGVFQGKISVAPQAQKTDAKMETRALLLSERSEMDAKPELEIYADDVKCAHGATIGTLDEQSVFYLQSRGIPLAQARRMLVSAFVEDALDVVVAEPLKEALRTLIEARLSTLEGVA